MSNRKEDTITFKGKLTTKGISRLLFRAVVSVLILKVALTINNSALTAFLLALLRIYAP